MTTPEFYALPNESRLPFSEAARVGNMLYLSGQMGTDVSGKIVAGGIAAETRQIMQNISAALARRGLGMQHVVKCLVMLADMSEWPAMNAVYIEHFDAPLPVRSAFGANGLALGGRVEIECVAVFPD